LIENVGSSGKIQQFGNRHTRVAQTQALRVVDDANQLTWFTERQRAQQDGIDDTENGSVRAYPQCKRKDHDSRKPRTLGQRSDGIADVSQESVHGSANLVRRAAWLYVWSPQFAAVLADNGGFLAVMNATFTNPLRS
jgi:hypothetical protein